MKFIVDAQLSPRLAEWIASRGHPAEHVMAIGGLDLPDQRIWEMALGAGAVVVPKDRDFVEWSVSRQPAPQILWVRFGNVTNTALIDRVQRVWDQVLADLEAPGPASFNSGDPEGNERSRFGFRRPWTES